MEDSSWSGWTTPPPPPGLELGYPERRMLPSGPPGGWVGELPRLTSQADLSLSAEVRRGLIAYIGEPIAALEQGQ